LFCLNPEWPTCTPRCGIVQAYFDELQHGQLLLLVPEPSNKYDGGAIAVRTLRGDHQLGFIPRGDNVRFASGHGLPIPARVARLTGGFSLYASPWYSGSRKRRYGEYDSGHGSYRGAAALGARIRYPDPCAGRLPLLPVPLPVGFGATDDAAVLRRMCAPGSPHHAAALARAAFRTFGLQGSSGGGGEQGSAACRCEVTSELLTNASQVVVVPLWTLDLAGRTVAMRRLAVVSRPVARALRRCFTTRRTAAETTVGCDNAGADVATGECGSGSQGAASEADLVSRWASRGVSVPCR
jgi:hypothetical protein